MKRKQIEAEQDGNGKRLHKRAVDEEVKWRTAHSIDDELRTKRQREVKAKPHLPERGEIRRREERKQQLIDRRLLVRPLLVAAKDDGPRLIKRAELRRSDT